MAEKKVRIKNPDRVVKFGVALGHPFRVTVLLAVANGGATSATMLAEEGLDTLAVISYHLRKLSALGVLKLVKETPKRGAYEKHYVLTAFGREIVETAAMIGRKR